MITNYSQIIIEPGSHHGDKDKFHVLVETAWTKTPDAVKAIGPEKCSGSRNANVAIALNSRHVVSDVKGPYRVDDKVSLGLEAEYNEKTQLVTGFSPTRIRASGECRCDIEVGCKVPTISWCANCFTTELDYGYKPVYTTQLNQELVYKLDMSLRFNRVIAQIKRLQNPGLNGEITYKHGVMTPEEVNSANKRVNKEAKTSLHSKPALAQRNKDNASRRVNSKVEDDKPIVTEGGNHQRLSSKVVITLGFGEPLLFVRPNGLGSFQISDSLREDEVLKYPKDVGHWILNNDGYSYRQGNGDNRNPLPELIIERELRSFEYSDYNGNKVTKDKTKHLVLLPFLKLLQKAWQQPEYGLSRETAIRNFGCKAFAESCSTVGGDYYDELHRLFDSTVKYFILIWIAKCHKIDLIGNVNPLVNEHNVFKTAWYNNYQIEQTGTYIKMNVSARHLPKVEGKYKFKTKPNVQIQLNRMDPSGKRVSFQTDEDTMLQDLVGFTYDPRFNISGMDLSRNYVSVGMDIVPCNWDRSDTTDTRSYLDAISKRLLGARDGERELWLNQQRWLCDVANRHGLLPKDIYQELGVVVEKCKLECKLVYDPYYGIISQDDNREGISYIPSPNGIMSTTSCTGHHGIRSRDCYERNLWSYELAQSMPEHTHSFSVSSVSPVMDAVDQLLHDTSRWAPGRVSDFLNTTVENVKDGVFSWYAQFYSNYINRETYANLPGPKRQLRQRVLEGVRYAPKSGACEPVAKLKDEIDKSNPEKPSRIFVSYGDESSFLDPALIAIVKKRLQGRITRSYMIGGKLTTVDCYTFTAPKTSELEAFFKHIIDINHTPNTIVFGCFSDDSVIAWNLPQGIGYANVDITSCDSSNGPLIFSLVYMMLAQLDAESAKCYLQQCHKPILCRNPQDSSQWFKILFPTCFEGSGTSLTTLLNTVASVLIFFAIVEVLMSNPILDISSAIQQGAALVGHKVTVDHCRDMNGSYVPEKIQFLKYSPIKTMDGVYVPSRNLGCIVRGLGKIFGDLTPDMVSMTPAEYRVTSAAEKFHRYISGVIMGLKNEAGHPLLAGLRSNFTHTNLSSQPTFVEVDGNYSSQTLDLESLRRRYPIDMESLLQMHIIASELRLGSVVHSLALLETLIVDYGLERREASPTLGTFENSGVTLRLSA